MAVKLPQIRQDWSAIIGFALMASPLAFLTLVLHEHYLGLTVLSPIMNWFASSELSIITAIVFLGGLTVAFALNTYALLGIRIRKDGTTFVSTISLTPRTWNVVVVLISGSALTIMMSYAIVENIGHA
jgi:hypothetical protein